MDAAEQQGQITKHTARITVAGQMRTILKMMAKHALEVETALDGHMKADHGDDQALNLTKQLFTTNNRTGCRFITIDAYKESKVTKFYKKNDFQFLNDSDRGKKTRIMYFDLKRFRSS